ncbi:MAG: hypothetical protein IBX56_15535 [Methylomicrobium sp.]|nr:hypothetical protein [Methylomicrobium sp.]
MKLNLTKILAGGFAGTLLMSLMMQYGAPMMVGQPMDIAAMIGNMMGGVYAIGMTMHIMLGVLVFPLLYALVMFRFLPGPPWLKGLLYGSILWFLAATMVMPMAGAGFFMSEIGGIKAAMAALMGHWVYGGLLGAIVGKEACSHCSTEQHSH